MTSKYEKYDCLQEGHKILCIIEDYLPLKFHMLHAYFGRILMFLNRKICFLLKFHSLNLMQNLNICYANNMSSFGIAEENKF
jgi:hypothetical protein